MRPLAALVLAALVAGCTYGLDSVDAVERTIPPAGSTTVDVRLDEGKRVEWSWTATRPLDYEVIDSSGRMLLSRIDRSSDASQFTATSHGTYTLSWTNHGAQPADVTYSLRVYGDIVG